MDKTAIVIGSGIVGLCSALRLAQDGWTVTMIDPRPPGEGCSAGNPGGISVSSVLPAASPGVIRKVPGWLLDRDGPLTIRPTYLPRLAPWLLRFVRASDPGRYQTGMKALYALTRTAVGSWQDLLSSIGQAQALKKDGHLIVYRNHALYAAEEKSWQQRSDLGLSVSSVEEQELRTIVPALAQDYALARRVNDNGWLIDPLIVCQLIADHLVSQGVEFVRGDARRMRLATDGRPEVQVADGWIGSDLMLLSAGAWSARLAKDIGDNIPLQPERGYSVTWDEPDLSIPMPVFSPSEKIMAAPTHNGIRFAGTAEFTGFDSPPRWERADSLERLGRRMFPGLTRKAEPQRWTGLRPSTPDGLPVLGRSTPSKRVVYAFGHGHIGVTSAARTAEIVVLLANQCHTGLDLAPYAPERF
jgi:D-amino-acid dehydrogenase